MSFCENCGSQLFENAKYCSKCGASVKNTPLRSELTNNANDSRTIRALKCELCGSNDVIKENGYFVCQHCGTKYSIEEARKMVLEGIIDIKGTVSIDRSIELKNLLELARRSRKENNSENAHRYYDQILIADPSNWEAYFFSIYYQSMSTSIANIQSAANRIANCLETVFQLIQERLSNQTERHQAVLDISQSCISIARLFIIAARGHYYDLTENIRGRYVQEYINRCFAARNLLYSCAGLIEQLFGEEFAVQMSVPCWEIGIGINQMLLPVLKNKMANKKEMLCYVKRIQKYNAAYRLPKYWSKTLSI